MRGFLVVSLFTLILFTASAQHPLRPEERRDALRNAIEKKNPRELDQILIWQQDFNKENQAFLDSILPFQQDSTWSLALQLYSAWIQVEEEQFTAELDSSLLELRREFNERSNQQGISRASYLYLRPPLAAGNFNRVLEALRAYSSQKRQSTDSTLLCTVLQDLGYIAEKLDNSEAALQYYKTALKHSIPLGFCSSSIVSYKNLSRVFSRLQQGDSAQHYMNTALALAENCEYAGVLLNAKLIVESARFKSELGLFPLAEADFLRARELYTQMNSQGPMIRLDGLRAENFRRAERYKEAQRLGLKTLQISRQRGMRLQAKESLFLLAEVAKAQGQYKASIEFQDRYLSLNDSILDLKARESLARLEMDLLFQQQWKTDSLHYAHKQDLFELEQRAKLRRQQIQTQLIFVIALAIVLLALMLLMRLRLLRKSKNALQLERDKSERLLLNILPAEVAEELKQKGKATSKRFPNASVLFTDFHRFTDLSRSIDPEELVDELHSCFAGFDAIIEKYHLEKIKTIGDAYMVAANLSQDLDSKSLDLVRAGLEMQEFIQLRRQQREKEGKWSFEMRLGIHTGTVIAGIVGNKKFQYDIWGETVNIASRMESNGALGEVNLSEKTYEEIKHHKEFDFQSRGSLAVKGAGEMNMFFVRRKS